ncbi:MAG: lipase family protein, partial [Steroidobacteraceae bacterium]
MLPINWKTAIDYAALIAIAESVSATAGYGDAEKSAITKAGYAFVQPIYGDDLCTDINPHIGKIVTYGFLATSPSKELVASVRGTADIWGWVHDACFLMVPAAVSGAQGFTEDGFSAVYRSLRVAPANSASTVRDAIKGHLEAGAATTVTVCGHSLGGALATLLTLDVALNTPCRSPISYTYASPRAGDHLFAASYNAAVPYTYRIAN